MIARRHRLAHAADDLAADSDRLMILALHIVVDVIPSPCVRRDVRHSGENIRQPGLLVDIVHLCRDDQGIHEGGTFATTLGTGE